MLSKEELLKYPDYLLTKYQLEIYRQVETYRQANDLSKTDLAKQMGVSNPYVSQILNGNFNYTLKKLIEIGLTIGQVPMLTFIPIKQYEIGLPFSASQSPIKAQTASSDTGFKNYKTDNKEYKKATAIAFSSEMKIAYSNPQQVA